MLTPEYRELEKEEWKLGGQGRLVRAQVRDGRGRLGAVCPKSLFQAKFQNGVSMLSRLRSKTDVSVLAIWNSGRTISRLSQFGGKS